MRQLNNFWRLLEENKQAIRQALKDDLNKVCMMPLSANPGLANRMNCWDLKEVVSIAQYMLLQGHMLQTAQSMNNPMYMSNTLYQTNTWGSEFDRCIIYSSMRTVHISIKIGRAHVV